MAVFIAVPGLAVALVAKPFVLGEHILFLGIFLAFLAPVIYLIYSRTPGTQQSHESDDRD